MVIEGWVLMIGMSGAMLGNINAGFSTGPFAYESGCKDAGERYKTEVNKYAKYVCVPLEKNVPNGAKK